MSHSSTDMSAIQAFFQTPHDVTNGDRFYRRYSELIHFALRDLKLTREDMEDIAQDAMVRIVTHFKRFSRKRRGSFRAWVRLVTRSATVDWLRKNSRKVQVPIQETSDAVAENLDKELELELLTQAIYRVRLEVSPTHWDMFDRFRFQGEKAQPIAERYGVSTFTVYKTTYRITERLKELIAEIEGTRRQ